MKNRQLRCLVLFPRDLETYYEEVYLPAIQKAKAESITLTRIITTSSRISKVQETIGQIQFVLADVTGRDKDVLFRAGLAGALGKHVGIISQHVEDIPSDLQHVGYAVYDTRKPDWASVLRKEITDLIMDALGTKQ